MHPLEEAMLSCDVDGEGSVVGRVPLNTARAVSVSDPFPPSLLSQVLPNMCLHFPLVSLSVGRLLVSCNDSVEPCNSGSLLCLLPGCGGPLLTGGFCLPPHLPPALLVLT